MSKSTTSKIRFNIKLDENNVPEEIKWIASDAANQEGKNTKSMMINSWSQWKLTTAIGFTFTGSAGFLCATSYCTPFEVRACIFTLKARKSSMRAGFGSRLMAAASGRRMAMGQCGADTPKNGPRALHHSPRRPVPLVCRPSPLERHVRTANPQETWPGSLIHNDDDVVHQVRA